MAQWHEPGWNALYSFSRGRISALTDEFMLTQTKPSTVIREHVARCVRLGQLPLWNTRKLKSAGVA